MSFTTRALGLVLASLITMGLSGRASAEDKPKPLKPGETRDVTEKGDVNGDGKPDVWTIAAEKVDPKNPDRIIRVLKRREADLNFDGRKDVVRIFDDRELLVEEQADLDFDGQTDMVNIYQNNQIVEKRVYHPDKSIPFIWKYYQDGKMTRLKRDENHDGKADYCELWYSGEKLSKRGWDKNNDGECDDKDYWEIAD